MRFCFIVYGSSSEFSLEKCISSILIQKIECWRVFFKIQNNYESSVNLIRSFHDPRLNVLSNSGSGHFLEQSLKEIDPLLHDDDVIIPMRGEDWLPHGNVIQTLKEAYSEGYIATVGSYVKSSNHTEVFNEGISPLNTFKYSIVKAALCSSLNDLFTLLSLVEQAGWDNVKVIHDIMYVYNDKSPPRKLS
jgi:hypothetical protein